MCLVYFYRQNTSMVIFSASHKGQIQFIIFLNQAHAEFTLKCHYIKVQDTVKMWSVWEWVVQKKQVTFHFSAVFPCFRSVLRCKIWMYSSFCFIQNIFQSFQVSVFKSSVCSVALALVDSLRFRLSETAATSVWLLLCSCFSVFDFV